MAKARVTIVVEYNLDPSHYGGETNPETMLQFDKDNYESGDLDLAELLDSVVDVQWEVVNAV